MTGNNEDFIRGFRSDLMKELDMKYIGHITYFFGIEFQKTSKEFLMHQRRYALEILKKFEMKHCNIPITPVEPRLKLSKEYDEKVVDPT